MGFSTAETGRNDRILAGGIVSDANRYAIETVGDPRYPLDLLLRVTTVSLETMKIRDVRALPEVSVASRSSG